MSRASRPRTSSARWPVASSQVWLKRTKRASRSKPQTRHCESSISASARPSSAGSSPGSLCARSSVIAAVARGQVYVRSRRGRDLARDRDRVRTCVRMIVCVLLPRFELAVAAGGRAGCCGGPAALAPEPGREQLVGEVSQAAEAFGVHAGMRLGEALARCPRLALVPPDPIGVAEAWERVLARLEALGAAVEAGRPGAGVLRRARAAAPARRPLDGVLAATRAALCRARRGAARRARAGLRRGRGSARARRASARWSRRPRGRGPSRAPASSRRAGRAAAPPRGDRRAAVDARAARDRDARRARRAAARGGRRPLRPPRPARPRPRPRARHAAAPARPGRAAGGDARAARVGLGRAARARARAAHRPPARAPRAARAHAARGRAVGAARRGRHVARARRLPRAARRPAADAPGARRQRLALLPAPAETLRLRVERFGPPHAEGARCSTTAPCGATSACARRSARPAPRPGPDAALRVLEIDPDSRVPERRVVLAVRGLMAGRG